MIRNCHQLLKQYQTLPQTLLAKRETCNTSMAIKIKAHAAPEHYQLIFQEHFHTLQKVGKEKRSKRKAERSNETFHNNETSRNNKAKQSATIKQVTTMERSPKNGTVQVRNATIRIRQQRTSCLQCYYSSVYFSPYTLTEFVDTFEGK